jgi:MSHA biogenesis protein MshL
VHPSVSQVSTVNKEVNLGNAGSLRLPLAASSTSEMDSIVRGQNGRIIALGGLMRQSSSGDRSQIPLLGDVAGLGGLFRNTANQTQKRELVVLIKPTIVDEESGVEDLRAVERRMGALQPRRAEERE